MRQLMSMKGLIFFSRVMSMSDVIQPTQCDAYVQLDAEQSWLALPKLIWDKECQARACFQTVNSQIVDQFELGGRPAIATRPAHGR
jgi:hypothetical protein